MTKLSEASIAIIIPDFDYGGEEKRVVFFANEYLAFFKEVYVFSPKGESNYLLDKRVKRIELDPRNFFTIPKVLNVLRKEKIHFLQGHKRATLPFLWMAEKFSDTTSVFNFDNIYLNNNSICQFISPGNIVYLSDVLKEFYLPYYKNSYNITINMGGDFYRKFDVHQTEVLRKELGVENRFVFLSLGRLSDQKNHRLLLKALEKIQEDFVCLIAGGGPLEEELMRQAKEYKMEEKIKFLGHRTNIEELLNISNALVQTSLFEGFPNVFIEAASVGVPIVATDVGSSKILIRGNGILVPSQNAMILTSALKKMMRDYSLYKEEAIKMSKSDFFKQFHKSKMLENYINYYQGLLKIMEK